MGRIAFFFARLIGKDRRHENLPVNSERRTPVRRHSAKEAQKRRDAAFEDLDKTVRMRREDLYERAVANDLQQVVLWGPFRDDCKLRGSDALKVRLCRHPRHEDAANSALAICEEQKCPILLEAIRGAAA